MIALPLAIVVLAAAIIFAALLNFKDHHTMSALDDSLTTLTGAVSDNTTAINNLITAKNATEPTPAQLQTLTDATTALAANTKAATDAVTPPAPTE